MLWKKESKVMENKSNYSRIRPNEKKRNNNKLMNETARIKWNWSHSEQKIPPCIYVFFHFYFYFFNIPLFVSYGYKLHLRL